VIDIPKDVQNSVGTFHGDGMLHFRGYESRMNQLKASRVSKAACADFFRLLSECDRPLIYAGGGVINGNAAEELRAFATSLRIPVVTTLLGIGAIDTRSELALHMLGMHGAAYANYAVEDCDFLFAVGARFDDRVAGKVSEFAAKAKYIAHIDIDAAEIGKVKPAHWAHVGHAREALANLLEAGRDFKKDFTPWCRYVKQLKTKHAFNYDRSSSLIQPQCVIECLNEITRGEAIICTGVGQHQMWSAQYFDFARPRSFITSGSMGTMGFGLPASIGAQLGRPGELVIDVDGDGSLRMNLGELETLTTYNVPVKVLLLNNLGDGMVRQWQALYFGDRFCGTDKSLHKKAFVKAAEADGFGFAKRLTDPSLVKPALEEFVSFDGPALLDVMIDPNAHVYPMVGPGLGYKDMLTGKYITSRSEEEPGDLEKTDMTKIPELF
jgi:acetolactate synthase-1/2/3 large subunit